MQTKLVHQRQYINLIDYVSEHRPCKGINVLTFGVGQDAVERREVAWARGDSEGVVLREAVSRGST